MQISQRGIDLIKGFEAFKATAYNDATNNATIGYGTLLHLGPCTNSDKLLTITRERAEEMLREHLSKEVEPWINKLVTVPLSQNQFDCLCSFVYNLGAGTLRHSSLLVALNEGGYRDVPRELGKFVLSQGHKLPGLEKRRFLEAQLWNEPEPVATRATALAEAVKG